MGFSDIGGTIPITTINTDLPAGPSVTFTLAARATVLMEYGGLLSVTSRGNSGFAAAMSFQPAIDGAAPAGREATFSVNDQQDSGNPFTTGQSSVMATETADLAAGSHTIRLFVSGTTLQSQALFPWLKVTRL